MRIVGDDERSCVMMNDDMEGINELHGLIFCELRGSEGSMMRAE